METNRNYLMKLYQVEIKNRIGEIVVNHYEDGKFYTCNFINDNVGDFYNLFESFGFYIDKSNEQPEYTLNGKLALADAKNIWTQIELQFDNPNERTYMRVNF